MNTFQKRVLLFLFGCILTRFLFVIIAKNIPLNYLPIMGMIALLPAIGFTYIYLTDSRKTGPEVFGDKIWWNDLRPIHAILYFLFAYFAITKQQSRAWKILLIDVLLGLAAFTLHHSKSL